MLGGNVCFCYFFYCRQSLLLWCGFHCWHSHVVGQMLPAIAFPVRSLILSQNSAAHFRCPGHAGLAICAGHVPNKESANISGPKAQPNAKLMIAACRVPSTCFSLGCMLPSYYHIAMCTLFAWILHALITASKRIQLYLACKDLGEPLWLVGLVGLSLSGGMRSCGSLARVFLDLKFVGENLAFHDSHAFKDG